MITAMLKAALVMTAVIATTASRAEKAYIDCEMSRTVDDKGTASPISGADVYALEVQSDGSTTYTLDIGCKPGTLKAAVTDEQYEFSCNHLLVDRISFTVYIHRVSGEYTKIVDSATGGYVNSGRCAVRERLF